LSGSRSSSPSGRSSRSKAAIRAAAKTVATAPSFTYRAGVRLSGTTLACDPMRSANELVFLSHESALPPGTRAPSARQGWQQVILTSTTLALLGKAGAPLRARALLSDYGRPFNVGALRLELFPSGHGPGSAALLCSTDGRRLVYTGPLRVGALEKTATFVREAEIRPADALCIDATYGDPRFVFPPREEALQQLRQFVQDALGAGHTPVVLVGPVGSALEIGAFLEAEGHPLRAYAQFVTAAQALGRSGATAPAFKRFTGKCGPKECLLWPMAARKARPLGALASPEFVLASGLAVDVEARSRFQVDAAIALSGRSGAPDLVAYAAATGADEVACFGANAEALAKTLRSRGHAAYPLSPPRQISLF
jgi:putative mRNA 3-end processing factor